MRPLIRQAMVLQDFTFDRVRKTIQEVRPLLNPSLPLPHLFHAGSRRLFGAILESKVCVLLDTSGSMGPYLQQVKTELILLIWEQLRKHCDRWQAGLWVARALEGERGGS